MIRKLRCTSGGILLNVFIRIRGLRDLSDASLSDGVEVDKS